MLISILGTSLYTKHITAGEEPPKLQNNSSVCAEIRFRADVPTFVSKGQEGKGVGSTQLLETPSDPMDRGDPKGSRGRFASGVSSPDILVHSTSLGGTQLSLHNSLLGDILNNILINTARSLKISTTSVEKFVTIEICRAAQKNRAVKSARTHPQCPSEPHVQLLTRLLSRGYKKSQQ